MSNVVALLPVASIPPESQRIEVPESMHPDEQAKLLRELGSITTAITRTEVRSQERSEALEKRIAKLEKGAEATGAHEIVRLETALRERKAEVDRWKWWLLSIASTLITSAIVGLVVYYFSTR